MNKMCNICIKVYRREISLLTISNVISYQKKIHYDTIFSGAFIFNKSPTFLQKKYLTTFSDVRHMRQYYSFSQ